MKKLTWVFSFGLIMLSCQSSGQQEKPPGNSSSGFSQRRQPPEDIMKALPVIPDTVLKTAHFLFLAHGPVDRKLIEKFAKSSEASVSEIIKMTGWKKPLQVIPHHLYVSSEEKGLILKNTDHSHVDAEKMEAHTILNEIYEDNFIGKENELLLHQISGKPKTRALECGLAIFFAKKWQVKGYAYWAARLAAAEVVPSLSELLDESNWSQCSHVIGGCMSAAFVEFLIQEWGEKTFFDKYAAWQTAPEELSALEKKWIPFMAQKAGSFANTRHEQHGSPAFPYLKGFNFAHEGYGIYNGYGSRKANEALSKLMGLGANTVAIIPYSFIRNPSEPATIPVVKRPGTENDEAVIHTAFEAKKQGFLVMVKPQIWMGRGSWTGDIAMNSEADWQAFFKQYTYWIAHYAMMAEIYGWDFFCAGNEMVQTTLKREADWRSLIRKMRVLYSGSLTYAANWGDEFEKITFWDDLDFIGLNCYYPLSQKDNASDKDLSKGFANVIGKIEKVYRRYNKPVVFTEIGFPSHDSPWKEPHKDWRDAAYNGDDQKRCYEIVFQSIQDKSWCQGILWWKFPSDMERRGTENSGFTPHNKPAEEVVKAWFKK